MLAQAGAVRRSRSPDKEPRIVRKRRRKALSCYNCRRRKLKCDRGYPCGRCRESGRPDSCVYESLPIETSHEPASSASDDDDTTPRAHTAADDADHLHHHHPAKRAPADVSTSLLAQERKMALLESRVASLEHLTKQQQGREHNSLEQAAYTGRVSAPSPAAAVKSTGEELQPGKNAVFRGKGFKTKYQGMSSPTSCIAEVLSTS